MHTRIYADVHGHTQNTKARQTHGTILRKDNKQRIRQLPGAQVNYLPRYGEGWGSTAITYTTQFQRQIWNLNSLLSGVSDSGYVYRYARAFLGRIPYLSSLLPGELCRRLKQSARIYCEWLQRWAACASNALELLARLWVKCALIDPRKGQGNRCSYMPTDLWTTRERHALVKT